jgi:hypothetical protein
MLASILRVAESLDRSHGQVISSLELRDAGKGAALRIHTDANTDAELELWAAARHLRPFEKLVRKSVTLELATAHRVPRRRAAQSLAVGGTEPLK